MELKEQLAKMELKAVEERPLTSTPKKQVQFDDNQEISQTLKFHESQVIKQEQKIERLKQEFLEKKQSLADRESKNYIEKRKDSNTKIKIKIEDMKGEINQSESQLIDMKKHLNIIKTLAIQDPISYKEQITLALNLDKNQIEIVNLKN